MKALVSDFKKKLAVERKFSTGSLYPVYNTFSNFPFEKFCPIRFHS